MRIGTGRVGGWGTAELDKVGLVLLITRCNKAMNLLKSNQQMSDMCRPCRKPCIPYLTLQFDLLLIGVWSVPFGETGLALAILHKNEG